MPGHHSDRTDRRGRSAVHEWRSDHGRHHCDRQDRKRDRRENGAGAPHRHVRARRRDAQFRAFTATGTSWGGDLVFTGTGQATSAGVSTQSLSASGTYSNTASTLTLNLSGTSTVYQILYAGSSGGAATHAELVDVYSSTGGPVNDCIDHGEAVRK